MAPGFATSTLEVFSTSPQSSGLNGDTYLRCVGEVARWSEQAGCRGILVYADNRLVDPWLVAHLIIQQTTELCPLVAVQPVYAHPYTVAKLVASLSHLYGRRVYLNMVAGGFKNDLTALNDETPHDQRYARLVEYTLIIRALLSGGPVTYDGAYYKITNLTLSPAIPASLFPGIFVSGSSEAGVAAARAVGGTAIKYPKPHVEEAPAPADGGSPVGLRVGIIARADAAQAWDVARERFPPDRKGQVLHQLAMKVSDSAWHRQISELATGANQSAYWLEPFQNYQTMCPYLVGSYEQVGDELSRYVALGFRTAILDIPPNQGELEHTGFALREAQRRLAG